MKHLNSGKWGLVAGLSLICWAGSAKADSAPKTSATTQNPPAAADSTDRSSIKTQPPAASKPSADEQKKETEILSKIHAANEDEIHAGEMAQNQGQSTAVKRYGETLIKDHQQADVKVQQVASREGITLTPPEPTTTHEKKESEEHQKAMDKLKSLHGAQFDKQFAESMLKDHKQTIHDLEVQQAQLPQASPVRQLIGELLPTLKQHRDMASTIAKGTTQG